MTGEQIHSPLPLNNSAQPIVATAQNDGVHREVDPNTWRQRQHLPSALRTATTYAGSQPSRKLTRTEPNCASTDADASVTTRTGSTRGVRAFFFPASLEADSVFVMSGRFV